MYFSAPIVSLGLGLGFIPGFVSASGGFFESCHNDNLYYSTINGDCNNVWTSIDLNSGIYFDGDNMQFGGPGFFNNNNPSGASGCFNCNLYYAELNCQCNTNNEGVQWRAINLDSHLAYDNGMMYFN